MPILMQVGGSLSTVGFLKGLYSASLGYLGGFYLLRRCRYFRGDIVKPITLAYRQKPTLWHNFKQHSLYKSRTTQSA